MVASTNPKIDAGIAPQGQARAARAYFKSALGDAFYYVEMRMAGGRYVGVLPKPTAGAGSVVYYVQATAADCTQGQTAQANATVVEVRDACQGKDVAAVGPPDPVRVFSVNGDTALPPGFTGISSVVAAGPGPCAVGPPATPAGGSFFTSKTGLVAMGGLAAGVGAAVIIDDDDPPASPIR
jgi:hypothetical protein